MLRFRKKNCLNLVTWVLLYYKHNYANKLIHEFANKTTSFEQMGHYLQLFDTDGMLARKYLPIR